MHLSTDLVRAFVLDMTCLSTFAAFGLLAFFYTLKLGVATLSTVEAHDGEV